MVLIARQRPEAGVLSGSSMWMGVGQVLGASSVVFSLISRGWIRSEAARTAQAATFPTWHSAGALYELFEVYC